jgi:hypothetical protein
MPPCLTDHRPKTASVKIKMLISLCISITYKFRVTGDFCYSIDTSRSHISHFLCDSCETYKLTFSFPYPAFRKKEAYGCQGISI